jgi:hypothetical protein
MAEVAGQAAKRQGTHQRSRADFEEVARKPGNFCQSIMPQIYQVQVIAEGQPLEVFNPVAVDAQEAIGAVMYRLFEELRGKTIIEIKAILRKGTP